MRYEPVKAGRQNELYQMGLEHLGGDARAADVEVLAIAAECLERLGVQGFVLAVGHVGVFAGLVEAAGLAGERARGAARPRGIEGPRRRPAGARRECRACAADVATALERLTLLGGGRETLEQAASVLSCCAPARAALEELRAVTDALAAAGLGRHVAVDLAEVRGLDYYTGLVFRVFAPDLGFEVGGGGRYDTLLARFGRPLPAVGFMLGLDRVALLLERQGRLAVAAAAARRRFAGRRSAPTSPAPWRGAAQGARVRFGNGGAR